MDLRHRLPIGLSLMATVFTGSIVVAEETDHTAHHATAGEPASQQQKVECPMMGQRMKGRMGQDKQGMMGMVPAGCRAARRQAWPECSDRASRR